MAWGITTSVLEKALQVQFPSSQAGRVDDTTLAIVIADAEARVDALLEYNGYTVATVQAATSTGGYNFCNNLVLDISILGVALKLRTMIPQAGQQTELSKSIDMRLAKLEKSPLTVMAGIAAPGGAADERLLDSISTGWDYQADATVPTDATADPEFSRESPIY